MIDGSAVCEEKEKEKGSFDEVEVDFGESLEFLFEFGLDERFVYM
jgi:hypothetical protein